MSHVPDLWLVRLVSGLIDWPISLIAERDRISVPVLPLGAFPSQNL